MEISLRFQARRGPAVLLRAFFAIGLAVLSRRSAFAAPTNPSGLPLPRFVVIRAKDATVRVGPGYQYDVAWKYLVAGLPVEVIQEFDVWRKIRDVDGTEGWVHQTALSGGRAGYVLPSLKGEIGLRAAASDDAGVVAWVGPGFPVKIQSCDGAWCDVSATDAPPDGRVRPIRAICRRPSCGASTRAKASTELDRRQVRPGCRRPRLRTRTTTSTCVTAMPGGGVGQVLDDDRGGGDVDHPLLVFEIEMVMVRSVGIEIAARRVDRHFPQQPRCPELVQRVVNRRQRDIDLRAPASASNCSALTCRCSPPNRISASATRCRVGRNPAMRSTAVRHGRRDGTLREKRRCSCMKARKSRIFERNL